MRTALLSMLMLIIVTLAAAAQDKAKPNTLTPKEIAAGWILLFDGETTFGCKVDGEATVADGVLRVGGKKWSTASALPNLAGDYHLEYEYRVEGKKMAGMLLSENPIFHCEAATPGKDTWKRGWIKVKGTDAELPNGNTIGGQGAIWPCWATDADTVLLLRSVKLRPTTTKTLFNGKDLTAWNVFPGKKSQFTVRDGAIHLKNGPGDLQTEGKYTDFVLQLECKSNGKYLNSGIFFRCKPNEYQNGYEAQIHNHFTAEPAKDYTIEEYDPKTHELLGKQKVKYAATDYGTGAIYRRVPARKEVAKDGEWFTMTVVAHGNHIATWVNGIQQVDWYDNRPASDNPRTGCRLEAGHISIQGHDPTTDLSFRNIRIAELPAR
jgi:Domain of Unknown Function (DUF1080)